MVSDSDILEEGRMPEEWDVLLYNIALRQDDMRTMSTDLLLSRIEEDPAYREMVDRGLITYKVFDHGSKPIARLHVTLKGLRYCTLHAEEIEPLRAWEIDGRPRQATAAPEGLGAGGTHSQPPVTNFSAAPKRGEVFVWKQQLGSNGGVLGATNKLLQRGRKAEAASALPRYTFASPDGAEWSYEPFGDAGLRIVGVSPAAKVLEIPGEIAGVPVVALADQALANLEVVREIVCSDGISAVGRGAFRGNSALKRLVLPASLDAFEAGWVGQCPRLEELVLPGLLEKIDRSVLVSDKLRSLRVGRATRAIAPGTFCGSQLDRVSIDSDNPFFATDGAAIYTKDGAELVALACPVECLEVKPGCKRIAKKCCHGFTGLCKVRLPESLEEIGPFAFSDTGLSHFEAPPLLKSLGEKAFLNCAALKRVNLNEGLRFIGDSAFQGSALEELSIPASIERIGASITQGTAIVHSGPRCSLTIEGQSAEQFFDGEGGLYRREEDGIHLVQLVDREIEHYAVLDGAAVIDPFAFAYNERIVSVKVPSSVRSVGSSAFRVCRNLRRIDLPDTVQSIGEEAFLDTSLEQFRVPAQLTELGRRALVTFGAHFGSKRPSLARIEVAPGNGAFYLSCGMLCRRGQDGSSVVVYAGPEGEVAFPPEITHVEDYAFSNARGIRRLALNPELSVIGAKGLATNCWIRDIRVELAEPLEGRRVFNFHFPNTPEGVRGITLGLGGANWVNVPGIFDQLDVCLTTAHDYNDSRDASQVSAYEQARLILERLSDPVMLSEGNRAALEKVLRGHVAEICVDATLHDDRSVFDDLLDRGFVNEENLDQIIERVTALRDAATSAFLLEAKRTRFAQNAFDYDL